MPIIIRLIVMGLAALGIGGGLIAAGHIGDAQAERDEQERLDKIRREFVAKTGIDNIALGTDAAGNHTLDVKVPAGHSTADIDAMFGELVVRVEFI
jgi:hypothetical protein